LLLTLVKVKQIGDISMKAVAISLFASLGLVFAQSAEGGAENSMVSSKILEFGDKRHLELGLWYADQQWEDPRENGLTQLSPFGFVTA